MRCCDPFPSLPRQQPSQSADHGEGRQPEPATPILAEQRHHQRRRVEQRANQPDRRGHDQQQVARQRPAIHRCAGGHAEAVAADLLLASQGGRDQHQVGNEEQERRDPDQGLPDAPRHEQQHRQPDLDPWNGELDRPAGQRARDPQVAHRRGHGVGLSYLGDPGPDEDGADHQAKASKSGNHISHPSRPDHHHPKSGDAGDHPVRRPPPQPTRCSQRTGASSPA